MKKETVKNFAKMVVFGYAILVSAYSCTKKDVSFCMDTTGRPQLLHMASMYNDKEGIGVGFSGFLVYTEDGGTTWTEVEKKTACLFAMDWINNKDVVAGGNNGGLIKTTDGGRNWIRYPVIPVARVKDVSFKSFEKGWLCSKTTIYETLDEGKTWTQINNPEGVIVIEGIYMVDKGHGFVCSTDGVLYETKDSGSTWQERAKFFDRNNSDFKIKNNQSMVQVAISFKDDIGYVECVGSTDKGNALKSFKSVDNGATWQESKVVALNKLPVAVNICLNDLISITNSDSTTSVYKIN